MQEAVFLVHIDPETKLIAATTRPDSDHVGLPGGKLHPGETHVQALLRELSEEGWHIEPRNTDARLIRTQIINEKLIHWLSLDIKHIDVLPEYKDKDRIKPLWATRAEVAAYGHGNEFLIKGNF